MAAGPVQSGRHGKCYKSGTPDVEIEITKWTRQGEAQTDVYATSLTDGEQVSSPGNLRATGTIEGKRRTDSGKIEAIILEGDQVTLKLGFNSTTGMNQPATIKSIQYEVDVDGGGMQTFVANWESNGARTFY